MSKSKIIGPRTHLTTVEVALLVSRELGLSPCLSSADIDAWCRRWPADLLPPRAAQRRLWGPEHVERIREEARRRRAPAPRTDVPPLPPAASAP